MLSRVRCPAFGCRAVFEVASVWLGRNMHCPTCGVRMTAKPAEVEARLLARQARTAGQALSAPARLPLAVLVDNVRSLWNVGSIFRTADACGACRVVLVGITGCPPRPEIEKTALGAERAVSWSYRAAAREGLADLAGERFVPVALEASDRAVSLDEFAWPERVALVVGNEVAGVSPEVLEVCEHHVSIPMRGVKESLNVAVAFGIAAHRAATALERACRQGALALVGLACAFAASAAEPAPAPGRISLPLTIDRVWFRTGAGGTLGKSFKSKGDLLVTAEGLEFSTRKRTISIPMERIGVLSYGKMKGDVDTDWAVIALGHTEPPELVGVRDGSKLGYGVRTRGIFDSLKAALKVSGAGPYRVPAGFRAYDGLDDRCTLAVPVGWDAKAQSVVLVDDRSRWGAVIFAAEPLSGGTDGGPRGAGLARALGGDVPAFFLERAEARRGWNCERLSAPAVAALIERASRDPLLAGGLDAATTSEGLTIDGCHGMRVVAFGRNPDGHAAVVELLGVAKDDAQFVFGLRALAEHYESYRQPFATAVSTFRFAVAR